MFAEVPFQTDLKVFHEAKLAASSRIQRILDLAKVTRFSNGENVSMYPKMSSDEYMAEVTKFYNGKNVSVNQDVLQRYKSRRPAYQVSGDQFA